MTALALKDPSYGPVWSKQQPKNGFMSIKSEIVDTLRPQVSPVSTAVAPTWYSAVLTRLYEISLLPHNWDDRGSAEIPNEIISFAYEVINQIMPPGGSPPAIIPLGNGSLQLVWNMREGEVEVEIVGPSNAIIFHHDKNTGSDREWSATTEFFEIADVLWRGLQG